MDFRLLLLSASLPDAARSLLPRRGTLKASRSVERFWILDNPTDKSANLNTVQLSISFFSRCSLRLCGSLRQAALRLR
ncbi:hypothetical protein [Nostoc sp.]|uniref:hypothetical protein n=1 Tax=Nostoc sp. TaxID=1180 RepID=UPI002FF5D64B